MGIHRNGLSQKEVPGIIDRIQNTKNEKWKVKCAFCEGWKIYGNKRWYNQIHAYYCGQ